jgi:hypothetical protein
MASGVSYTYSVPVNISVGNYRYLACRRLGVETMGVREADAERRRAEARRRRTSDADAY